MKIYLNNLAFKEYIMKKKNRGLLFLAIAVIFTIASLYFDNYLIQGISFLRNSILDKFFLVITFISSELIIFFVLTALFLWRENKRRWILPLWMSLGVSGLVGFILKIMIQRARPYQLGIISLLPGLAEASHSIWNFSFPSFHAMFAFCAIPILVEQFPRLKKVWIVFAVLVAFSRVYLGLHFVSDIIAGALIGYLIGMMIVRLEKEKGFGRKIYDKIFRK
jgi:undecaprenyl-diphosphatase